MKKQAMNQINQLSPIMQEHYKHLLANKAFTCIDGIHYMQTSENPFEPIEVSEVYIIEYVVWNKAAMLYKYGKK